MIHSGNCDCPFPGRGCVWEVPAAFPGQPHPPSRPGRTALPRGSAGSRRDRSPEQRRKRQVRRAAPGQPSTCGRRGAPVVGPRLRSSLPPRALCYSPTSCLRPPDPGSLPGPGSRRRPRVSRRLPRPLGSAPCISESHPGLGARAGPGPGPGPRPREASVAGGPVGGPARVLLPGARGRCAAVGAARGGRPPSAAKVRRSALPRLGGCEFSFRPRRAVLLPGPETLSRRTKLERDQRDALPQRYLRVSREAGPSVSRTLSCRRQPAPSPPGSPRLSAAPPGPRREAERQGTGLNWEAEAPFQHHLSLASNLGQVHPLLHSFHTEHRLYAKHRR